MTAEKTESTYEKVVELAKRRGFFWPSFSIYGGEAGFYDYGPLGVMLKDNIIRIWKEAYLRENALLIDTPVLVPRAVFQASGHVDKFLDIAAECDKCHLRQKLETFTKSAGYEEVFDTVESGLSFVRDNVVKCTNCGTRITRVYDVRQMFFLPDQGSSGDLFLRPETAQGIFINFKILNNLFRGKLPMAVAQTGKGFRNEIAPRQSLIRMREFNMCEVEVFVHPEKKFWAEIEYEDDITICPRSSQPVTLNAREAVNSGIISSNAMGYFITLTQQMLLKMGISRDRLRFRQHEKNELAHYSFDSWDAEAELDGNWIEITGIADRNDLRNHEKTSGESMSVSTEEGDIVPSVIEPASGVDRIVLSVLMHSLKTRENGYTVLSLPPDVAPYHAAVFPLMKKNGMDQLAREIFRSLSLNDPCVFYDESGSIGKRYARQDEVGTPYCITIDGASLEDGTVTIRERDSAKQIRIAAEELINHGLIGNPSISLDKFKNQPS